MTEFPSLDKQSLQLEEMHVNSNPVSRQELWFRGAYTSVR